MASPLLRSRRSPADTGDENVQPVSEADHRAIEWLRSQGIDPRDHTPGERVQMWRDRDVPPFDPSSPEERYANSPDEWTGNYDPIPYRPNGLGPVGASPGWRPSDHDARTPEWYDEQYGHWGSLIRQLEGGQDWGPYRRLEAAQRLEQLGPDLVEQYGHGFDPTAGIEAGDYTGERDTRAPAAVHDPAIDGPFGGLERALREGMASLVPGTTSNPYPLLSTDPAVLPSDAMPLPFLEPRTEEERAADQSMEADRARQARGITGTPPSAARRWGITPPPLRMSTTAAEMPGPNTAMTAAPSGVPGGFAGKNWYYGNQGALAGPMEPQPAAPTPAPPLQSQKGREGPKKSPADVRFPIQAVLDQTGMSLREISRQVGASPSQLRDPRGLTVDVADRVAVALGAHPIEFWPDFHAGIDTSDVAPQSTNPGLAMPGLQGIPGPNTAMSGRGLDADPRPWWMKLLEAHNGQPAGWMGIDPSQQMPPGDPGSMTVLPSTPKPPPYDWGPDPDVAGPNTMMNAADAPSEGTRPPFPTEWDVNNPEHRQRHFEDVYSSLLDQLAGNYGHDAAHEAGADLENMPRVGPGSAYSQGRDVKRPGDFGLPPWFSDDGTTNERRDWLVQHPEYQVAPDFTDQQDYPVDIPYEDQDPQGGGFGWRQTHFGGDEFDRYWAGPQRGVGKADQAGIVGEQQSRKFQPPSSTAMVGASSQPMWRSLLHGWGNGNTAMSTTSPDGEDIPDWMTPQDVTDAWSTYPPMPDPTNPQSAHPSMGGGGALPPGYQPYVPGGEQPKPTTHVPVPGAWDYNGEPMRVPVDPGYDDRYVEGLNMGDQMAEWLAAAREAQQNNQPLPPIPGGMDGGLSAMGGGAAVPRRVGGYASQFRPQALGGYQAARPLAPMGGYRSNFPAIREGGFVNTGSPVRPSTSFGGAAGNAPADVSGMHVSSPAVYAGLLDQMRRNQRSNGGWQHRGDTLAKYALGGAAVAAGGALVGPELAAGGGFASLLRMLGA